MEIKNLVKGKKYKRIHTETINGIKYTAEGFPGIPGADREGRDICTISKQI